MFWVRRLDFENRNFSLVRMKQRNQQRVEMLPEVRLEQLLRA